MLPSQEGPNPDPAAAQLRARIIGKTRDYDRETIAYWQNADEQTRGRALYELLALTERIMASTKQVRQEPNRLILKEGKVIIQPRE